MPEADDLTARRAARDAALTRALAAEARLRGLDEEIVRARRTADQRRVARLVAQRDEAAAEAKNARDVHAKAERAEHCLVRVAARAPGAPARETAFR